MMHLFYFQHSCKEIENQFLYVCSFNQNMKSFIIFCFLSEKETIWETQIISLSSTCEMFWLGQTISAPVV